MDAAALKNDIILIVAVSAQIMRWTNSNTFNEHE